MTETDETIKWLENVITDDSSLQLVVTKADMSPEYPLALACYYNKKGDIVRRDGYMRRAKALIGFCKSGQDVKDVHDALAQRFI